MQPYTYFIFNKPTGLFYYGVKYAKNANPDTFWINYFTSSKKVKELITIYGKDSFDFKIRKVFTCPLKAKKWEDKVIRRIRKWPNCLNITLGGDGIKSHHFRHLKDSNGLSSYDKASRNTAKTRKKRGDFKMLSEKMKNIQIGHNHICEYCGKEVRGSNFKRWHGENCKLNPNITNEQLEKRVSHNKGKKLNLSDETREKLSNSMNNKVIAFDLINNISVKVSKEEFETNDNLVGITSKGTPAYNKIFKGEE